MRLLLAVALSALAIPAYSYSPIMAAVCMGLALALAWRPHARGLGDGLGRRTYHDAPAAAGQPPIRVSAAMIRTLIVLLTDAYGLYGYDMGQLAGLGPARLYACLDRLEGAAWVKGSWETPEPLDRPCRRYYRLTSTGRAGALAMFGLADHKDHA